MIHVVVATLTLALFAGLLRAWPGLPPARRTRWLRVLGLLVALGGLAPLLYRDGSALALGSIPWLEHGLLGLDERGAELGGLAICGYGLWLWQGAPRALAGWHALAAPVLLAAAFAALNVNHFLYRYLYLEAAALATLALTVTRNDWRPLAGSFLVLRLGDLALLGTIILLWQAHATLLISPLLTAAALAANGTTALALALGLLAVWIKLGLYPADGWLLAAGRAAGPERFSATAAGLPLLGAYLLYRLVGSLHALALALPLAALGALLALWALLRAWRAGPVASRVHHLRVAHGALALVAIPLGAPYLYLYAFVPLRAVLALYGERLAEPAAEPAAALAARDEPVLAWKAARAASQGAAWLEFALLDRGLSAAERAALGLGGRLRRLHTGRLRVNLAWMGGLIAVTLVLVALLTLY